MARIVKHTKVTTEELADPWTYRAQGALGLLISLGVVLLAFWLAAQFNL